MKYECYQSIILEELASIFHTQTLDKNNKKQTENNGRKTHLNTDKYFFTHCRAWFTKPGAKLQVLFKNFTCSFYTLFIIKMFIYINNLSHKSDIVRFLCGLLAKISTAPAFYTTIDIAHGQTLSKSFPVLHKCLYMIDKCCTFFAFKNLPFYYYYGMYHFLHNA